MSFRFFNLLRSGKIRNDKIAVIGGGPSGLACAEALALKGYTDVTVFEKRSVIGGLLSCGIPSLASAADLIKSPKKYAKLGIKLKCGTEVGKDVSIEELREQGYRAFCFAAGASANVEIGIRGEDLEGVYGGIDLLRACASGSAPDLGSSCTVIGGCELTVDTARVIRALGVENVTVVYNRRREDMAVPPEMLEAAEADGIAFEFLKTPAEITGTDGRADGLWLDSVELREMAELTRVLVPVGLRQFEHRSCDSVVIAVGRKPDIAPLDPDNTLFYNLNGSVRADPESGATNLPDVFICGDLLRGGSPADAAASGIRTAAAIDSLLRSE